MTTERPRCEKCGLKMRKKGTRKYKKKTVVRFKCFKCGKSKEVEIDGNTVISTT